MLFIFSLIIASIFALTAKSTIKRHPYPWYIGALALTLFISLFPFSRNLPEAVTFLLDLFRRGALSCALWCIVMWTGAFSNGSWLIKRLMPVRGELSIFAAMLTLGHNIGYGRTYAFLYQCIRTSCQSIRCLHHYNYSSYHYDFAYYPFFSKDS